jgi:hypothetical protein
MTYQDFQMQRGKWRTKELEERAADIASPRPPLNNSITDQAIRELFDRVKALEALQPASTVNSKPVPPVRPFSLPS